MKIIEMLFTEKRDESSKYIDSQGEVIGMMGR